MRLEDFPNIYSGDKNCFDCKHFKIMILVRHPDGLIKYNKAKVRCTRGGILREPKNKKSLVEPVYVFQSVTWTRIKRGWRHPEWGVANVCDHFKSMEDDQEENLSGPPSGVLRT